MNDTDVESRVAAATAYENLFVPALFAEWAARVMGHARLRSGQSVLDVACGTGVLTREVVSRVGPSGRVAAVDVNDGMLAVASRQVPGVEFRQAPAEELPYPDRSFDAVVSQFGLMYFTDRQKALREMRRVLAPGGVMAVAVWDTLEHTPAYAAETRLFERLAGKDAGDALRHPFVLGDRAELEALFASAGLSGVTITTDTGAGRFPSIRSMVEADLRGWLPIVGVVLPEEKIQQILREADRELAAYATPGGETKFATPAHIVVYEKS